MINIREYRRAESLEEAWQLNQKRSNRVIGGMMWVKMGRGRVQTAIDLSGLGLDTIEEREDCFVIGSMVTLRQLELHEGLNRYTDGAMKEALRHIVGVQFRNGVTVGGSLYGRYGFSDVLTIFMAMGAKLELYKGGIVSLEDYAAMPYDRDILVRVLVEKKAAGYYYQSVRNTETDFPVLTCAAAMTEKGLRICVGARPQKAVLLAGENEGAPVWGGDCENTDLLAGPMTEEKAERIGVYAAERIPVSSNLRGSAAYRKQLVQVLATRAAKHFIPHD